MSFSIFAGRALARHSRHQLRQFSCSRFLTSYQSYSLPAQDSKAENMTETSIAYPESIPKVHETRPPPGHKPAPVAAEQLVKQPAAVAKPEPGAATKAAKPTRPRSKLRPRKAAMKLTPAAVEQLRAMLDQPEPKLIKVGVRNRGCSGLAYHLEYVDKPGAFDEAVEQDGVKVLIDSKALFSIIGSEMDWAEDKLSQRFVFKNPNISEYQMQTQNIVGVVC